MKKVNLQSLRTDSSRNSEGIKNMFFMINSKTYNDMMCRKNPELNMEGYYQYLSRLIPDIESMNLGELLAYARIHCLIPSESSYNDREDYLRQCMLGMAIVRWVLFIPCKLYKIFSYEVPKRVVRRINEIK